MSFAVWTALLAASPFGPYLVLGPTAPGLGSTVSYSLTMMLLISWHWLGNRVLLQAADQAGKIKDFIYKIGKLAALFLMLIGMFAAAISCQVLGELPWSTISSLISAGTLLRIISTFSWCLYAENSLENTPVEKMRTDSTPVFLTGCAWPAASTLASILLCKVNVALCPLTCMPVFTVVLTLTSKKKLLGHLSENAPQLLIAGHLLYSFYLEMQHLLWSQQITTSVYTPQALGAYLVALSFWGAAHAMMIQLRNRPLPAKPSAIDAEPEHDNRMADVSSAITKMSKARLTERELTVLARTALGESATSIARALGIAEATVASYRRRGYTKLDVAGASDLRSIIADTAHAPKDPQDRRPPAEDTSRAVPRNHALSLAISMLLLVAVIWPDQIHIVGFGADRWVSNVCRYALYATCALLLLTSVIQANKRPNNWTTIGQEPLSIEDRSLALGHHLLYATGIAHAWSCALIWTGIGLAPAQYFKSRAGIACLLLLFLSLLGRKELCSGGAKTIRMPRSICRAISIGAGRLASMGPENYFFLSASLFLSEWLESNNITILINATVVIRPIISILVLVLLLRHTPNEPMKSPCGATERAVHYLMGRGLGELQSKIVIDLVCGYSRPAICERNSTTPATISSYRTRTLKQLRLASIDDLRKLLQKEADFTR